MWKAMKEQLATVSEFLKKVDAAIITPLILLLFALALAYFLWGLFVFIRNTDSDEGRSEGKQHMIWGIVGMVIMLAARTIIEIGLRTFGVNP